MTISIDSSEIELPELSDSIPTLGMQAIHTSAKSEWVILKGNGTLWHADFSNRSCAVVAEFARELVNWKKDVAVQLTDDGRFAAIYNKFDVHGVVVELATGRTTMILARDVYRVEHCAFPLAFVNFNERWLLVHGTAWNRLDISDPATGELLTSRESPKSRADKTRPEHYLDYFHGSLLVSPDHEWIADHGWAWQPTGVVTSWSIRRWLVENVWESEDGPTNRALCEQENWNQPMCWIDNGTLAALQGSYAEPGRQLELALFDVHSGSEIRKLPIGDNRIFFQHTQMFADGQRLFVYRYDGVSVWDIEPCALVFEDQNILAMCYHRGTKQFVGTQRDGKFIVSRVRETD